MIKDDYNLEEKIKIKFKDMPYYVMPRYKTHYVDNDYEKFSLQILKNNLDSSKVFLDIGAHYGAYSLYAANAAGSKVIAIEPVAENFQLLNQNVKVNKLSSLITTHNYAVSDENGQAEFNIPWASDSAGFYEHPNAETIRVQKVEVRKIDDLLEGAQVDLIKIDTEGHEISVLKGLEQTLANNPQAKLIVELNPECLKRAGKSVEELLQVLKDSNKEIYIVDEDNFSLYRISDNLAAWRDYVEESGYANLYCVPNESHQYLLAVSHSSRMDGGELALVDQARVLRDLGNLTHIILPANGPLVDLLTEYGIGHSIVENYSFWIDPGQNDNPNALQHRNYLNIGASAKIVNAAKKIKPTIILNNTIVNPWGYPAAKYLGLPLIWMIHEYGDIDHDMPFTHTLDDIRVFITESSDLVFCCSNAVREKFISGNKELDSRIHTLYNFIDPRRILDLSNETIKKPVSSVGIKSTLKFCIAGTVKPKKGQIIAIKAMAELKKKGHNPELLILGQATADYKKYLQKTIRDLDLVDNVKLLGQVANPYPYMKASDIVLVCSDNEAFGRATAEAMIIGKPVIGSNAGGTTEMISNGITGRLFKPSNVADLVTQIEILIKSDTTKIAKQAKEKIAKLLDNKKNAKVFEGLIANLIEDPSAARKAKIITTEWVDAIDLYAKEYAATKEQLDKLHSDYAEQSLKASALAERVNVLQVELDKVTSSRSWKVTQPLRLPKSTIKKLRG